MENKQALPHGWELQETGCNSCGVRYNVLFEGRLLDRDLSYEQALDFIAGDGRESLRDDLCPLSGTNVDVQQKGTSSHTRKPCPDSDGLGFWGNEAFTVGYVEEVNGPDSVEMPEFVPTRYELLQLGKYWVTLALDLQFDFFLYAQTGSSEWRREVFAKRRVGRIAKILGREQVDKLIDQVYEEYGKKQDARAWAIFMTGTPEEQEAFQDEIQRRICEASERADSSPLTPNELARFDVDVLTDAA